MTLSASDSPFAYGVINDGGAPLLTNVTLSASGNYAYGVSDHRAALVIRSTTISVTGASNAYGIYSYVDLDGVPFTVTINNSQITSSGATIYGQFGYTVRVVGSQLAGGPVSGGETTVCAGVYDENYVFYASTCP